MCVVTLSVLNVNVICINTSQPGPDKIQPFSLGFKSFKPIFIGLCIEFWASRLHNFAYFSTGSFNVILIVILFYLVVCFVLNVEKCLFFFLSFAYR